MATWRTYATGVFVTGGILIGTLTYRYVTGQATAELAGAAWERSVVARHTGTNAPALWYGAVSITNRVTNYVATVTITHSSGSDGVDFSPGSLTFSSTNWSVAQLVSVTRKDPWVPDNGTYNVNYNGSMDTQVFYRAQNPGAGAGFSEGAATGPNVSWTPLTTGVGDDQPAVATVVLTHSPTNGTMVISTNIVGLAVGGMAAISPFVREDQLKYFLSELRGSMQNGSYSHAVPDIWWADPGSPFSASAGTAGIVWYTTPALVATTNIWEDDGIAALPAWDGYDYWAGLSPGIYATGGVVWASETNVPVTASAKYFTLNMFSFNTNGSPRLNYAYGLFGTPPTSITGAETQVSYIPPAEFPYLGDWPYYPYVNYVSTSGYTRAGSWWLDTGMHSNTMWQVQGHEIVTNVSGTPQVRYSSYISTNVLKKGSDMAGAMSGTVSFRPLLADAQTGVTNYRSQLISGVVSNWVEASTLSESVNAAWAVCNQSEFIFDKDTTESAAEYIVTSPGGNWSYFRTIPGGSSMSPSVQADTNQSTCSVRVDGACLDYPSKFAVTNGYVSRVRVYALYTASRGVPPQPYAADVDSMRPGETWRNTTWDLPVSNPGGCETAGISPTTGSGYNITGVDVSNSGLWFTMDDPADFFGLGIFLPEYNDPPAMAVNAGSRTSDYTEGSRGMTKLRVTEIADIASPSEYPIRVSFGRASQISFPAYDYTGEVSFSSETTTTGEWEIFCTGDYWTWVAHDTDYTETVSTIERYKVTERYVKREPYVIVVVDWNFKHMNPANPYTPEPFVPAWLTPAP